MRVIPVDQPRGFAGAVRPRGFWHSLAQGLDAYFADRTTRTVPEIMLRRSMYDIARCRRLVHKNSLAAAETNFSFASRHGVVRMRPR
jgi:hypothetical protein